MHRFCWWLLGVFFRNRIVFSVLQERNIPNHICFKNQHSLIRSYLLLQPASRGWFWWWLQTSPQLGGTKLQPPSWKYPGKRERRQNAHCGVHGWDSASGCRHGTARSRCPAAAIGVNCESRLRATVPPSGLMLKERSCGWTSPFHLSSLLFFFFFSGIYGTRLHWHRLKQQVN